MMEIVTIACMGFYTVLILAFFFFLNYKPKEKRMIDKIRKMNVNQLAELMDNGADVYCPKTIDGSVYCKKESCKGCIAEWLKGE